MKKCTPVNKNASLEVKKVLEYLSSVSGKGLITGQHTQTMIQKELKYIENVTGKLPALCGFEMLAYSPNINYEDASEECLIEVEENKNTLEKAFEWAKKYHGLVTLTWHWFSPIGGKDKSFYAKNTDFDASKAIIAGTEENIALIADMDKIAVYLKEFEKQNIPIIWRPFHESDGTWFWWGAKGCEPARELYAIMYDRYTNFHKLNNLIWVWNSRIKDGYVGDQIADIISIDLYPEAHEYKDFSEEYDTLMNLTNEDKITALAEVGVVPDIEKLSENNIPWSWFMIWSNEFCDTEQFTTKEILKKTYLSDYAITLEKLPKLF